MIVGQNNRDLERRFVGAGTDRPQPVFLQNHIEICEIPTIMV